MYSHILLPAGSKPAVKTKSLSGRLCEPPVPPPHCRGAQPCRAAFEDGRTEVHPPQPQGLLEAGVRWLPCLEPCPVQLAYPSELQTPWAKVRPLVLSWDPTKVAGTSTRCPREWSPHVWRCGHPSHVGCQCWGKLRWETAEGNEPGGATSCRGGTSLSSPSETRCLAHREGTTMLRRCWCHAGNVKGLSSGWVDLWDVQ